MNLLLICQRYLQFKNTFWAFGWVVVLIVSIVCFPGCGTSSHSGIGNSPGAGTPTSASALTTSICNKLVSCLTGVAIGSCTSAVFRLASLGNSFGTFSVSVTMSDLDSSETSGTVTVSATNKATCTTSIGALSCSDSTVTGAYNANLAIPYTGVTTMVNLTGCSSVFSSH